MIKINLLYNLTWCAPKCFNIIVACLFKGEILVSYIIMMIKPHLHYSSEGMQKCFASFLIFPLSLRLHLCRAPFLALTSICNVR